jgi:hypothetical protein
MGNRIDTRVVLGSLRYKSATDTNLMFNIPFVQTTKENVEFDRSLDISLSQVFDDERQKSDTFRPTCKFSILFKNSYVGSSTYLPLLNNLSYVNADVSAALNCPPNPSVLWSGYPQYNEFDFIRTDYSVPGYTTPDINGNLHVKFVAKSASTYNWSFYSSYPYDNNYNKHMEAVDSKTGQLLNWVCSDGIPFVIDNTLLNGQNLISFRCPMKHGLSEGAYVKLNFNYCGIDTFAVYSLGTEYYGSDEYVFSIQNVGFTGTTFHSGTNGTFKRIIDIENPQESLSKYYVRVHKILTSAEDSVLVKAGFDQNIFGSKKIYESSGYTPNKVARVSIRDGAQSYNLSFNTDININPLRDNQKRPITELFFTTIWKGYFGLTFGVNANDPTQYYKLKEGYGFNLPLVGGQPSHWWDNGTTNSDTNFSIGSYTTTLGVTPTNSQIKFTYIKPLMTGDTFDGDYCEWNDIEQKERVISEMYHKIKFNPNVFQINPKVPSNPFGYYYKPLNKITLRVFSDYVEEGDKQNIVGVPDYSYYSSNYNSFLWRDLYTYGYVDPTGLGVNYPFVNGTHYPFNDIIFRIIPEGSNYIEDTISGAYNNTSSIFGTITQPKKDNCE